MIVPPRREPGGPPRWVRRLTFGTALLALVASVPWLTRIGWRNAVSAEGQIAATAAADASAPGYQAMVTPTPTMLVVHRGPQGQLAGVSMLALAGDSGGGAVLLVPTGLIPEPDAPVPQTLNAIYNSGGVAELTATLGRLFRVGFQTVVTADARDWLVAAGTTALSVDNPDEVLDVDGSVAFEPGPLQLSGEAIERYLRLRNPGEDERGHLYRTQLLWQSWMSSLASAAPTDTATAAGTAAPSSDPAAAADPFASMVDELGRAPVEVVTLPVAVADEDTLARVDTSAAGVATAEGASGDDGSEDDGSGTDGADEPVLFVADADSVRTLVATLVPFPTSAQPGDRVRVRLLNGLGDPGQALNVASILVPAGAEITVFGNADRFDHATSTVLYYDPAQQANAEVLASVLGLASASYSQTGETAVDVTVIVGGDLAQPAAAPKLTVPSRPAAGNG